MFHGVLQCVTWDVNQNLPANSHSQRCHLCFDTGKTWILFGYCEDLWRPVCLTKFQCHTYFITKTSYKVQCPHIGIFSFMTHRLLKMEWYKIGDPHTGENMAFLCVIYRRVGTETKNEVLQNFVMPYKSRYCCSACMMSKYETQIVLKRTHSFLPNFL